MIMNRVPLDISAGHTDAILVVRLIGVGFPCIVELTRTFVRTTKI